MQVKRKPLRVQKGKVKNKINYVPSILCNLVASSYIFYLQMGRVRVAWERTNKETKTASNENRLICIVAPLCRLYLWLYFKSTTRRKNENASTQCIYIVYTQYIPLPLLPLLSFLFLPYSVLFVPLYHLCTAHHHHHHHRRGFVFYLLNLLARACRSYLLDLCAGPSFTRAGF